jgi:hypothetical protein
VIPLPIDVSVRGHIKIPGESRVIRAQHIAPKLNGRPLYGVQRLTVRDERGKRIVGLHFHPSRLPEPFDPVGVHVEIQFDWGPEDPAGVVEAIGARLERSEEDGRPVFTITGEPV